ncbi:MAG: peptidyl-prolyl cis-trans isomerase [Thermoleophilia bacterium]|nr:peptidyl-prolyl cis-trans isomerase [Thermoleophilia bacterium]
MTEKPLAHGRRRPTIIAGSTLAAAAVALGAAACGDSGSDLPSGVAARVGDTQITYAQLDRVMEQSKASATQQGQTFPAKGTEEYTAAQSQALQTLINSRIVSSEARLCGTPCAVKPADVGKRLTEIVKAQFQGKQAELNKFLKQRAMTMAEARDQVRTGLEQEKIRNHVTRGVRFTDADAQKYYKANAAQYHVPAGRTASHILVKTKAEAEKIFAEATPQNFADLAKRYSTDTGTKGQGGSLGPISKGQLVPEFEKVAFSLPAGKVSKPVKTQFGWHLILIDKITPARTIPFKEARAQIVSQQLSAERDSKFQAWVTKTLDKWKDKTVYAAKDLEPETAPAADSQPAPQATTP